MATTDQIVPAFVTVAGGAPQIATIDTNGNPQTHAIGTGAQVTQDITTPSTTLAPSVAAVQALTQAQATAVAAMISEINGALQDAATQIAALTLQVNSLLSGTSISPGPVANWFSGASRAGSNYSGYDSPNDGGYNPIATAANMLKFTSAGALTARLPVRTSSRMSQNSSGTITAAFFAEMDAYLAQAQAAGCTRIVVDPFHQYSVLDTGVATPGYETLWAGNPIEMSGGAYTTAANTALRAYQDMVQAGWVQIATRYKNQPLTVAFGLINEPQDVGRGRGPTHNAFMARLVAAIRGTGGNNATRPILFPTTGFSNVTRLSEVPLAGGYDSGNAIDQYTAVEVHCYAPPDFTNMGFSGWPAINAYGWGDWVKSAIRSELLSAARWSAMTGIKVFIGEYGIHWRDTGTSSTTTPNDPAVRALYVQYATQVINQLNLVSAEWEHGGEYALLSSSLTNPSATADWLPGMQSALTNSPPLTAIPDATLIANITALASFNFSLYGHTVTALPPYLAWDQANQVLSIVATPANDPAGATQLDGGATIAYFVVTDTLPVAGTTYQYCNAGVGINTINLTWFDTAADVNAGNFHTSGADTVGGSSGTLTIPANQVIPSTARLYLIFKIPDRTSTQGMIAPQVTIKPAPSA